MLLIIFFLRFYLLFFWLSFTLFFSITNLIKNIVLHFTCFNGIHFTFYRNFILLARFSLLLLRLIILTKVQHESPYSLYSSFFYVTNIQENLMVCSDKNINKMKILVFKNRLIYLIIRCGPMSMKRFAVQLILNELHFCKLAPTRIDQNISSDLLRTPPAHIITGDEIHLWARHSNKAATFWMAPWKQALTTKSTQKSLETIFLF